MNAELSPHLVEDDVLAHSSHRILHEGGDALLVHLHGPDASDALLMEIPKHPLGGIQPESKKKLALLISNLDLPILAPDCWKYKLCL